jgi:hypothetical protein
VSLAGHAAFFSAFAAIERLRWPEPPIAIELTRSRLVEETGPVDRRGVEHAPPAKEPPPKPAPKKASVSKPGEGEHAKKTAPAMPTLPAYPTAPATTDLRPFAPHDTRLALLFRSDALRTSPHRAGVEQLLAGLPDYGTLIDGTGLRLFDDFDALLIATSNPYDVTATFLAATYRDAERVQGALHGRQLESWDPRVFRFLRPGLAVLVRPDGATQIDAERSTPRDAGPATQPAAERWSDQLEKLDGFAKTTDGPALRVTMSDVQSMMRFGGGLPTPKVLSFAMSAEASPRVHLEAEMETPEEARALAKAWPDIVTRFRAWVGLLGLGATLDDLKPSCAQAVFRLDGTLPEAQLRLALAWAGMRVQARHQPAAPVTPSTPGPLPRSKPENGP